MFYDPNGASFFHYPPCIVASTSFVVNFHCPPLVVAQCSNFVVDISKVLGKNNYVYNSIFRIKMIKTNKVMLDT
jgi:hypothetical protein